ncbi:hypothetical protein NUU61_004769 [Penicillium alfredii]|uniref:Uncharacterized protein n=1 Tax=Penicillium alfredii TaxID=1506179 RepID=A0A9W9K6X7_9EURO|nr:uncharacterized protein NUU61_004769 [Penicillium alfredii]KAJ5095413.1 hypothetical protein NUU61_004769 [Penicillium alfredii]
MALRTSAENAEDVAAGFSTFRAPLPEHATEITGLISDLYAISSSLSSLDDLVKDPRYRRNLPRVHPDLELARASLKYTLEDIVDFFGRLDGGNNPELYRRTWLAMGRFFWDESHYSLETRLAKYKTFLRELGDSLKGKNNDSPLQAGFRNGIKTLLAAQDKRLAPRLGRMSLGRNPSSSGNSTEPSSPVSDRRPRRRSYERARPPHLSPQSPLSPSSGGFSDIPPSVPEAPSSPLTASTTATAATATTNSQSATGDAIQYHWAKQVFNSCDTSTPIPQTSEKSGCYGEPNPGIKPWLREQGYEELLHIAFNDDCDIRVYFYLRERDHRVRILCKVPHRTRPSEYFCLPLDMIEILREGSCLQLCRRRRSGTQLVFWATFKFLTIENMVLFYCMFLALRSQDAGHPVNNIRDYELEGEEELFGAKSSTTYTDTRCAFTTIRHPGPSDYKPQCTKATWTKDISTPVWTAFVTHLLDKRGWLRRLDARTVLVRNLQPAILMSAEDYNLPQTSRGDQILKFTSSGDADGFLDIMEELVMDLH